MARPTGNVMTKTVDHGKTHYLYRYVGPAVAIRTRSSVNSYNDKPLNEKSVVTARLLPYLDLR
jgi:hypothetical protein